VEAPSFDRVFRQLARRVRLRRTFASVLSGLTLGAVAAAVLALAAFALGLAELRAYTSLAVLFGALAGFAHGRRRRWSDGEVALFLDARLDAEEAFTTGLLTAKAAPEAAAAARARAIERLSAAGADRTRPRLLRRFHGLAPLALALFAWIAQWAVAPTVAAHKRDPGTELVRRGDVPGLDRIEALAATPALSPADAERLAALAREAKKLSDELARGIERREAQARIGQLRDELAGERQRFGGAAERAGLEAALRALATARALRKAERSLAEGDIVGFDDEMRRLANQAEGDARRAAREGLDGAARAARERGAKGLAELLERQKRLFAEREALSRSLRELARGLGEQLSDAERRELDAYLQNGDPEAAERLAEALGRALAELSEEERQRLVESLQRELGADPSLAAPDPERLRALLEQLDTPEGRRALRDALRDAARGRDAERERALGDAERGAAEAERSLGALPVPGGPGRPSAAAPGNAPPGPAGPSTPGGPGQAGPGNGPGSGQHDGTTPPIDAPELRAKAETRVLPGVTLGARGFGRAPGKSGERASDVGSGAIGAARPDAIGAIEGSDVPEEYREHVGRYFEP
jgi:hypothetical protein